MRLTVLGGSSVGTPELLLALANDIALDRLPAMEVHLYGRNVLRLQRIVQYVELAIAQAIRSAGLWNTAFRVVPHTDIKDALLDADIVLCQIRPGGMESRTADERLAWDAGVPGDEGLGPSGLACFLRGRETMTAVLEACAAWASDALFLQMTSPLGLTTALSRAVFGDRVFGVCELPHTTSERVRRYAEPKVMRGPLTHAHAGLNHQSWLYAFRDCAGRDVTDAVIRAIDDGTLVDVDPDVIQREGAVPVPYLRLFYHSERELARQQSAGQTRGSTLARWVARLHEAYCAPDGPRVNQITELLGLRDMAWYRDGSLPVLRAFIGYNPCRIVLNLPNSGAVPGIPDHAIVEVTCNVRQGIAEPCTVPPLPAGPAALMKVLVDYESAVLALPSPPSVSEIEAVLALHPLGPRQAIKAFATGIVRGFP